MGVRVNYSKAIEVENLDTIYITGGGYINKAFKGVGRNSAWGRDEVVWQANLSRSSSFAMTNIDNIGIGSVSTVEIIFPLINMEDFIALQKILHERHCIVNFFNVDLGKRQTKEMAVSGNERKMLYNRGNTLLGMRNVTIKFVATNRKIEEDTDYKIGVVLPISFNPNGGVGTAYTEDTLEYGDQFELPGDVFTNGNLYLAYWCTSSDGNGERYLPGQSITIWKSLTLYAIWGSN